MSFDMDSDAEDTVEAVGEAQEQTQEIGNEVASTSDIAETSIEGTTVQEAGIPEDRGTVEIDPGRLEGQHFNQILTVLPSDLEATESAMQMQETVRDYTTRHGYGPGPEVSSVEVNAYDAVPELGSYSEGVIHISNYTEIVNEATAAHEQMHAASINTEYVEVEPATGTYSHHDICGIDEFTTVYDKDGKIITQTRENEMLNEGLTVSYTREMLNEAGLGMAAETDEALSYDVAADVASGLREAFPDQTSNAYFNGQLEDLRSAVDTAAERQGTFDEISALLDRVGDESLSLEERAQCYDLVYDLVSSLQG